MARLEELISGVTVQGILPGQRVRVIAVEWYGEDAVDLTYENATGNRDHELVYRSRESEIELVKQGSLGALMEMEQCCDWFPKLTGFD